MANPRRMFKITHLEKWQNGTYRVMDTSNDPTWGDVKCVSSRTSVVGESEWLLGVTNHRDQNFEQVCQDLIDKGATEREWQDMGKLQTLSRVVST